MPGSKKNQSDKTAGTAENAAPFAAATGASAPRGTPGVQRSFWGWFPRELPWVLALCLATVLAWEYYADRLSARNWNVPVEYSSDSLQILGWIQAASEGDYRPFHSEIIHRLGAPYEANWNDYPMYEKIPSYLMGLLARWFGLMQASNAGILLSHITSALAFYICCRWLKHRREWSFVGALLFSFTFYHIFRNLSHLLLAFTWTVPVAILSVWLMLFSRRMRRWDGSCRFCLITAVIMGLSNPYNLNMYAQLLVLALAVGWFINRRRENLIIGAWSLGLAAVCFLAINFNTFAYQWAHGKNGEAIVRKYSESELYSLKPIEFVIPPMTHHLKIFSDLGYWYRASAWVEGEMFSPYLGVVGIAALLWLVLEAMAVILRVSRRKLPPHALQGLWIFFYAILGGLNCVIAFAGLQLFRAGNRFSIFISALLLLFLVSRLSRLSRHWTRTVSVLVAGLVLAAGLFDQLPRRTTPEETDERWLAVENDRAFAAAMEARLPKGAMVFQLPVMVFPDAVPTHKLEGYAQLRPYFFSRTLRFSFGSNRGRPREDWQKDVAALPPEQMVATLEKYGFSAIYFNRNGYTNEGAELLTGLVDHLPGTDQDRFITDSNHEAVCVFLKPSAHPELPPDNDALITYRSGWTITQQKDGHDQRWTRGNATITFFNPSKEAQSYVLTGILGSFTERAVSIESEGRQIWSGRVKPLEASEVKLTVLARPGNNWIEFKTPGGLYYPADKPDIPMSIGVQDLEFTQVIPSR